MAVRLPGEGFGRENETYIGNRLQYDDDIRPGGEGFLGNTSREAWSAWAGTTFLSWLVAFGCIALYAMVMPFLAGALGSGTTSRSGSFSSSSSSSATGWILLTPVVFMGIWIVAWFVISFLPRWRWLSQWQLTIDGQGAQADQCYGQIFRAMRARHLPVQAEPVRVQRAVDQPPANYLRIRQGNIHTYIGVFSYGTGLFMTWAMWKRQPAIVVMASFLSDRVRSVFGQATMFHQMVRSDPDRALREAVHGAVREGVEAAITGTGTSLLDAFGAEPPVEAWPGSTGPAAAPPAPPGRPPYAFEAPPPAPAGRPAYPSQATPPAPRGRPPYPSGPSDLAG